MSCVWILVLLGEAFEVMLLPRRVRRRLRLVRVFFRFTWRPWSALAGRVPPGDTREMLMSLYGPLSMVLLLMFWVSGLILGFALLQFDLLHRPWSVANLANQLYFSGTAFFTLNNSDPAALSPASKFVEVIEAGTGFGFIAAVIGYLPVLYQLFSRRESQVIMLDAHAGSPPSAVALLERHFEQRLLPALDTLLAAWERWAAELIESHLSYPMLSYYRSQHDNQSWLAALTCVMDSCALALVVVKQGRKQQARMTFAICRLAIIELCRVFQIAARPESEDRLPEPDYRSVEVRLLAAGYELQDDGETEENLRVLRATYEPFLVGLADYLLLPLPRWLPETERDNWQNSPRGKRARQIVEEATRPSRRGM